LRLGPQHRQLGYELFHQTAQRQASGGEPLGDAQWCLSARPLKQVLEQVLEQGLLAGEVRVETALADSHGAAE